MTEPNYKILLDEQTARITGLETSVASMGGLLSAHFNVKELTPVIKVVVTDARVSASDLPVAQTNESAGMDLRAYPRGGVGRVETDATGKVIKEEWVEDAPLDHIILKPGEQMLVSTGLRVWIDKPGYAGFMFARSGMGVKGLVLGNGTGVIDSDYQGDLKMCLWNRGSRGIKIEAGERVAQLVIMPVMTGYKMEVVENFDAETERGTGGFGSTGSK